MANATLDVIFIFLISFAISIWGAVVYSRKKNANGVVGLLIVVVGGGVGSVLAAFLWGCAIGANSCSLN
jgi:hypothetical protein